jgi:hypothetical protein
LSLLLLVEFAMNIGPEFFHFIGQQISRDLLPPGVDGV